MKRTLLALAASAATVLATTAGPAAASNPVDVTKESCFSNQTLRAGCVSLKWDASDRNVRAIGVAWSKGDPKVGAVTELTLQRRTCGGSWSTVSYDADPDGYAVLDTVGSPAYSAGLTGRQWRAKVVVSWKVSGYPSTRGSSVRTTPVFGSC